MSELIIPRYLAKRKPQKIVFWFNKKADFIMCPPSPLAPPPAGFQKVECQNASEVQKWSSRLRTQEKRVYEMTELERYELEGKIQSDIIAEMEECYRNSTDPVNREFMAYHIRLAKAHRAQRRPQARETFMHCEAEEGVAP